MHKNKTVPYNVMGEHGIEELEAKLWIARNNAEAFAPTVRPALQKANEYWNREVDRLQQRIRGIFGI